MTDTEPHPASSRRRPPSTDELQQRAEAREARRAAKPPKPPRPTKGATTDGSRTRRTVEPGILRIDGPQGTRYQASVGSREYRRINTFPTVTEARLWRAEQMRHISHGFRHHREMPTLETWIGEFIYGLESGLIKRSDGAPYRETTIKSYHQVLSSHVIPEIGKLRLDAITFRRVQQLSDELSRRRSGNTVQNTIRALSSCFQAARREGLIVDTPVQNVRSPKRGKRGDESTVSREEAAAQIALIPAGPYRRLAALWFYAGLRLGESLALTPADINPLKQRISVTKSLNQHGTLEPPKNGKPRQVPIFPQLQAILDEPGPLLPPHKSRPWLGRKMKAWGVVTTPHQARHTFASMLIDSGKVSMKQVSEIMGHSGISITMDTYGHLYPSAFDETIAVMGDYLENGRNSG